MKGILSFIAVAVLTIVVVLSGGTPAFAAGDATYFNPGATTSKGQPIQACAPVTCTRISLGHKGHSNVDTPKIACFQYQGFASISGTVPGSVVNVKIRPGGFTSGQTDTGYLVGGSVVGTPSTFWIGKGTTSVGFADISTATSASYVEYCYQGTAGP